MARFIQAAVIWVKYLSFSAWGRKDAVMELAASAFRSFSERFSARVIAMPDPRLDQIAVLCVETRDDMAVTDDDITGFLRERIASYKVPKRILYFSNGEIPLTASGTKVVDDELRKLVTSRLAHTTETASTETTEPHV